MSCHINRDEPSISDYSHRYYWYYGDVLACELYMYLVFSKGLNKLRSGTTTTAYLSSALPSNIPTIISSASSNGSEALNTEESSSAWNLSMSVLSSPHGESLMNLYHGPKPGTWKCIMEEEMTSWRLLKDLQCSRISLLNSMHGYHTK